MKWLGHFLFIVLYLLVSFFGLGPVLFADGTMKERVMFGIIVIGFYVVLSLLYRAFIIWVQNR